MLLAVHYVSLTLVHNH